MLNSIPGDSGLHYADHVSGSGVALFDRVCEMDLEGIVAKHATAPYLTYHVISTWYKIKNPRHPRWRAVTSCSSVSGIANRFRAGTAVTWRLRGQSYMASCAIEYTSGESKILIVTPDWWAGGVRVVITPQ